MLHDCGHVLLNHARIVGIYGYRFRVLEVIKPHVLRASGWYGDLVRSCGLTIREEDRDLHLGLFVRSVEQASCLVAGELWFGTVAPAGDVAFGYGPPTMPYGPTHRLYPTLRSMLFSSRLGLRPSITC